jgi:1-acyl-sn-glycerol-3-phosphate acyltransferase
MHKLILLRACFRAVRVVCHILYGMLLACIFPFLGRNTQRLIMKHWSRSLMGMMNVKFAADGCCNPAELRGRILVANHISWLDVIALNAIVPSCFVAKSEIRNWPLLGWMCQQAGTLFIKREMRRDTLRINGKISSMLSRNECVALFPEGTSTEGETPGHFHSSLLQGAIDINSAICPVAIRYHDGKGKSNKDAAYVGEMTFIHSLWKILCSQSLYVNLSYLPPITSVGKNRRLLASEAQSSVYASLVTFSNNPLAFIPEEAESDEWESAVLPI